MRSLTLSLALFLFSLPAQGCSIYLAATQPEKVDATMLEQGGLPRDVVLPTLGAPTATTKEADGSRVEVFQFYGGSATGWKMGRAAIHAAADFFTLGLWEIVGTPTEMAIKGSKLTARATFDHNETLREFAVLGREKALRPQEKQAEEAR